MDNTVSIQLLIEKHQLTERKIRNGYQLLTCDNTIVFEVRGQMKKVLNHTWRYLRNLDLVFKALNQPKGKGKNELNYSR